MIFSDSSRTTVTRVDRSLSVLACRHRTSMYDPYHPTDCTHIFDGLSHFPTHVAHMRFGSFVVPPTPWPFPSPLTGPSQNGAVSVLYTIALQWLKEDRDYRRGLEKQGLKLRGARCDVSFCSSACPSVVLSFSFAAQAVPSDSETFYKKYAIPRSSTSLPHIHSPQV